MAFEKYFSGLCPACLLEDENQELWLNKGDLFECPKCYLLVSLASPLLATILKRRGQGNFKSLSDRYYCAAKQGRDFLLTREDQNNLYHADGFNVIETMGELRKYLNDIIDIDRFV